MEVNNAVKQVIVIRKDLNMRKGKMAAQAAHASNKIILDPPTTKEGFDTRALKKAYSFFKFWQENGMTKIVVGVNTETELLELYQKAKVNKIPVALITDAGITEFDGVETKTCIAIGPYDSETLNLFTGDLKLL